MRSLETAPNAQKSLVETQFNKYQPLGKGWISIEVKFFVGGKLVTMEEYADVKGDPALPDALFDPSRYGRPGWVK